MKNKLLTATGPELSQLLGEVLQPEKTEHIWEGGAIPGYKCCKCKTIYDTLAEFEADECTVSDPIPLTWPEAMKHRDILILEDRISLDEWYNVCRYIYIKKSGKQAKYVTKVEVLEWWVDHAQPKHYLIAAALCKENEDE